MTKKRKRTNRRPRPTGGEITSFSDLTLEKQREIDSLGKQILCVLPKGNAEFIKEVARRLNVSIADAVSGYFDSISAWLSDKTEMRVDGRVIRFTGDDLSFMALFEADYKKAKNYFNSFFQDEADRRKAEREATEDEEDDTGDDE